MELEKLRFMVRENKRFIFVNDFEYKDIISCESDFSDDWSDMMVKDEKRGLRYTITRRIGEGKLKLIFENIAYKEALLSYAKEQINEIYYWCYDEDCQESSIEEITEVINAIENSKVLNNVDKFEKVLTAEENEDLHNLRAELVNRLKATEFKLKAKKVNIDNVKSDVFYLGFNINTYSYPGQKSYIRKLARKENNVGIALEYNRKCLDYILKIFTEYSFIEKKYENKSSICYRVHIKNTYGSREAETMLIKLYKGSFETCFKELYDNEEVKYKT